MSILFAMAKFVATADYRVIERAPLCFQAGEEVTVDAHDRSWPGWVWVIKEGGRGGYVPVSCLGGGELESGGRRSFVVTFNAHDLSVHKGDALTSLREVDGWHWCRDEAGEEGWVAGYLLRSR